MKAKAIFVSLVTAVVLLLGLTLAPRPGLALFNGSVNAACGGVNLDPNNTTCAPGTGRLNNIVATVINILSVVVGIVAVIMIIIAGFKFLTSGGDAQATASARNTIIYAIVGLVVVAMAQIIVKFVLDKVTQ